MFTTRVLRSLFLALAVAGTGCTKENPTLEEATPADRAVLALAQQYCDTQIGVMRQELAAKFALTQPMKGDTGPMGPAGPAGPSVHLVDTATGEDLGILVQDDISLAPKYGGEVAWTGQIHWMGYDDSNCSDNHEFLQWTGNKVLTIGNVGVIGPDNFIRRPKGDPITFAPTAYRGYDGVCKPYMDGALPFTAVANTKVSATPRKLGDLAHVVM